jgi:hypothetical protein
VVRVGYDDLNPSRSSRAPNLALSYNLLINNKLTTVILSERGPRHISAWGW